MRDWRNRALLVDPKLGELDREYSCLNRIWKRTTRRTQECKTRSCTYLEQRSNYIMIMITDEGDLQQSRARTWDMNKTKV